MAESITDLSNAATRAIKVLIYTGRHIDENLRYEQYIERCRSTVERHFRNMLVHIARWSNIKPNEISAEYVSFVSFQIIELFRLDKLSETRQEDELDAQITEIISCGCKVYASSIKK